MASRQKGASVWNNSDRVLHPIICNLQNNQTKGKKIWKKSKIKKTKKKGSNVVIFLSGKESSPGWQGKYAIHYGDGSILRL
jgi:hypothetical protein